MKCKAQLCMGVRCSDALGSDGKLAPRSLVQHGMAWYSSIWHVAELSRDETIPVQDSHRSLHRIILHQAGVGNGVPCALNCTAWQALIHVNPWTSLIQFMQARDTELAKAQVTNAMRFLPPEAVLAFNIGNEADAYT
eukprot:366426-Chlamydomonas_euryale.AAC.11